MAGNFEYLEYLDDRMRDVEDKALRNELGLDKHEDECAIRYAGINENVSSIKRDIRWFFGAVMLGMAGILSKLLFFTS